MSSTHGIAKDDIRNFPPIDYMDGHGTHTLSTAGGSFVHGVNVFGFGNGTAKGGAPKARVASYKVSWRFLFGSGELVDPRGYKPGKDYPVTFVDVHSADWLAAIEEAIKDGVDVLSISLTSSGNDNYYKTEPNAIGALHAVKKGVVVVAAAGNNNDATTDSPIANVAPWIITVAASTMDREFTSYLELPNKKRFKVSVCPSNIRVFEGHLDMAHDRKILLFLLLLLLLA